MLFTRAGLEQASSELTAAAQRPHDSPGRPGGRPVLRHRRQPDRPGGGLHVRQRRHSLSAADAGTGTGTARVIGIDAT